MKNADLSRAALEVGAFGWPDDEHDRSCEGAACKGVSGAITVSGVPVNCGCPCWCHAADWEAERTAVLDAWQRERESHGEPPFP